MHSKRQYRSPGFVPKKEWIAPDFEIPVNSKVRFWLIYQRLINKPARIFIYPHSDYAYSLILMMIRRSDNIKIMDREYTLIKLLGIIHQCPAGERHSTCLIKTIKNIPSARLAFNYLRTLSDKELQDLYNAHYKCYNSRTDSFIQHRRYELN